MSWADDKVRIRTNQKKLTDYKKKIKCKECGLNDYRVIDFHHIRDKEFAISNMVYRGYSWNRIQKEIDKCIPLCSNCHRIEHHSS
tara:strand:- start:2822 stop:3076 length:255 start_codon:yes stop_codon:yes gene_type:complete